MNTESNTENIPKLNIEINITVPGGTTLNFPEAVTIEALGCELLELECAVPEFRYKSRADFRPRKGVLDAYRRNETGFGLLVSDSFRASTLHAASMVLVELFWQLQEAMDAKNYDKAAALLLFNLDEGFVSSLNLFEDLLDDLFEEEP